MKNIKIIDQIYKLVSKKLYISNIILIFLFIVQAILETFSIGIILPLLNVILNENFKESYEFFYNFLSFFGNNTPQSFLISCVIILFLSFVVKNIYSIFVTFYQARFTHNVAIHLSKEIFFKYLTANYKFHVNKNTSKLIRNIHAEVNQFNAGLMCFLQILSDLAILFFIFALLLFVDIQSALIISLIFGISSFIYYYNTKKRILLIGDLRIVAESNIYKIVSQALYGIRDVIFLQSYKYFLKKHEVEMYSSANVSRKLSIFNALPRIWMETIAIGSLCAVIIVFVIQGYSFNEIITISGVFAATGFRLLPAVNRLLGNFQKLKFVMPVIINLGKELNYKSSSESKKSKNANKNLLLKNVIKFQNVSFYHEYIENGKTLKSEDIFTNINFEIKKGEVLGIFGKSGSGKSTLIDLIGGLIEPTAGKIVYDDNNSISDDIIGWQSQIAYVSQNSFLVDDSIKNNIAFGIQEELINLTKLESVLQEADLLKHVNSLPQGINTLVGENGIKLSGGQRQRICIARYLYFNRDILIFDESTSSLDIDTERNIVNTIKNIKGGKTIIIVSHRLSALKLCDRFVNLENNKINFYENIDEITKKIIGFKND